MLVLPVALMVSFPLMELESCTTVMFPSGKVATLVVPVVTRCTSNRSARNRYCLARESGRVVGCHGANDGGVN